MPIFNDKHLLNDDMYWSAQFESWNQRTDELYYQINLFQKAGMDFKTTATFSVQTYFSGNTLMENDALFQKIQSLVELKIKSQ